MPQVPHTEPAITPHQALIYVMIMASAVDRIMSDAEMEQIGLIVRRLPAFQDYNKNRLVKTAQACRDSLARHEGFTQTLTLIEGALSKDLHVTAYAFAVEVMAVDKTVNLEEVRLLEILAERFELSDLEIAAIKQSAEARFRMI